MAYCGYITTAKNLRPHPNADRLVIIEVFGNSVCVAKDKYYEGMRGVYFPTDGQLSMEFCTENNLLAIRDDKGNNISGGYMDPKKRNVKTIKLRGEPSDGLFLPIDCLSYTGCDLDSLSEGTQITVLNGHEICRKYIPRSNSQRSGSGKGKKKKEFKFDYAPTFFEHKDTEQLAYNLHVFKPGDRIEITRKLHGTSGRTAHVKVLKNTKKSLFDRLFKRPGTPIYDWGYVSGTRRTVLENYDGGYYGSNEFREPHSKMFEGKLFKGESVYYEIVGFTNTNTPIMPVGKNKKVGDDFVAIYGDTTTFSYSCAPCESDVYVYRMTMTNEDGDVVEYDPDYMRYRCEQIGVKTVPVMWAGYVPEHPASANDDTITAGEWVQNLAEKYYSGPEPIDPTHIREGVVVRVLNRPAFTAYKHKNIEFKIIEGIIKESASAPDMEEAEEIKEI